MNIKDIEGRKHNTENEFDMLVIEYRNEVTTERRKNKIFTLLAKRYDSILTKHITSFAPRYHSYINSEYQYLLLRCITNWKGVNKKGEYSAFLTYWYTWANKKVKSEVLDKYVKKDRREVTMTDYNTRHIIEYNIIDDENVGTDEFEYNDDIV
jgi:hypothetical protein